MKPDRKRYRVRNLCASAVALSLTACSVAVFESAATPEPAPATSAEAEAESSPEGQDEASDVALVVGTAPQQRIELIEPGRNAPTGLIGDREHVDHGSGALTAQSGAPASDDSGTGPSEPEEEIALPPPPETGAQPSGPAPRAPAEEPEMPAPESDAAAEPVAPAASQSAASQASEPQTVEPQTVEPQTAASDVAASGGAFVQLAAFRSADQVAPNWAAIQRKFPDLLAGLSATTRQVDLGNRGVFYRLLAGPLPDAAAARRLCGELRARDQDCLLRLN